VQLHDRIRYMDYCPKRIEHSMGCFAGIQIVGTCRLDLPWERASLKEFVPLALP